jgi:signal transduction histidine kinase
MPPMPQTHRSFVQRQLVQALVWGGFMTVMLVFAHGLGPLTSGAWAIALVVGFGLWGASELLRWLALSRGWLTGPGLLLASKIALAVLLLPAIPQLLLYLVLTYGLKFGWLSLPGGVANYTPAAVVLYWINSAMPLALWSGAWVSTQYLRRFRQGEMARLRAEAARSAMEFDALRARLNPHFIFNALNNLRALINEDTERARDLVTRLSNTLRHALDHGSAGSVPLRRELEVVDDYLEIEKVHYEDRLQVQRDIAPEAAGAELPPMLLQLLVENAIKHGIARTPGGGSLSVQARMEGKLLRLAVENPGRLEGGTRGHGVGLSYLRSRLAQGAGEFTLTQQGDRVRATLDIPQ